MSKSPLIVEVLSGGQVIGRCTPAEFSAAASVPASMFLAAAIERFNEWKSAIGEPERAKLQLAPK